MQRWNGFAVKDDASGEHVAGAQFDVYQVGTTTAISIYGDNGAAPTPKSNPFTADANGYGFFYAESQRVDIAISGTGITTPYTISDVLLFDPADGPTPRYEVVYVPFSAMKEIGVGVPAMEQISALNLWARAFPEGVERYLYFSAMLPAAYEEGEDIEAYVHWLPADASTGNVAWQLGYNWPNADDQVVAPTTLAVQPASPEVALQSTTSSLGTISGTGKQIDSLLACYIERDGDHASDDYAADAFLMGVSFRFPVNTLGSAALLTK